MLNVQIFFSKIFITQSTFQTITNPHYCSIITRHCSVWEIVLRELAGPNYVFTNPSLSIMVNSFSIYFVTLLFRGFKCQMSLPR